MDSLFYFLKIKWYEPAINLEGFLTYVKRAKVQEAIPLQHRAMVDDGENVRREMKVFNC